MRKLDRHWVIAGLICTVVAGCGDALPDLTVTGAHKDMCVSGKSGVELLEAKIVNAGSGIVVLAGDDTKDWVLARPSLPLPDWATPNPKTNAKTLKPGESLSIPIKVIAPPHPDDAAYNLILEVDPKRAYRESDENNNEFVIPVSSAACK